ncbi:MAG: ATP-dependent Clp protease adapter ClpS [Polyangiaceae bacterium]
MAGPPDKKTHEQDDTAVAERVKPVVPRRYKVVFHNDDYTTMQFVVEVLMTYFHKTQAEATHLMLTVHKTGKAVAGVYTREIAETKVSQVQDYAKEQGMPLLLTAEPE